MLANRARNSVDPMIWTLDPNVTHLNHGSFGAAPVAVQDEQARWRSAMEANPVRFMLEDYQPALEQSRAALAGFIGADPAGVVFVRNATEGVNAVLRSLLPRFGPSSELVVTTHGYNACSNVARYVSEVTGAGLIEVDVPFPISRPDQITERVLDAISPATSLVMIDHVSSPTGVVFPVEEIIREIATLAGADGAAGGIPVLIDGAHAPGMIPFDIDSMGAAFVIGNCHKWMCAPKGVGYLYVAERYRDTIMAPSISHSYNGAWPGSSSTFHSHFDWTGTDDPSARLTIPTALRTVESLHPDGWPGVMAANHALVCSGRDLICDSLGIAHPAPHEMLGSIAAIPVPPAGGSDSIFDPLQAALRHGHDIEVPVFTWPSPPNRLLRISAQLYNTIDDYERLAAALAEEMAKELT